MTFAEPIAFNEGQQGSSFTLEGGARFRAADGTRVRIARWDQPEYRVV